MSSLSQNRGYQALSEQEKHQNEAENETPAVPGRRQARSKKFYFAIASLIAVGLLALVAFTSSWTSEAEPVPDLAAAMPMDDESREFLANLGRAGDQQYLLGVGKADITGYVETIKSVYCGVY